MLIALSALIPQLWQWIGSRNNRIADSAKVIAEGGAEAVKAVRELLADYDKIIDKQSAKIESLEKIAADAQEGREGRIKQIAELEESKEDLEAALITLQNQQRDIETKYQKDLEETQKLRGDYATAQKRIIGLEELVIRAGDYIVTMKDAMQKAGIPLPLNGELLESVLRLKAERAQRGKS